MAQAFVPKLFWQCCVRVRSLKPRRPRQNTSQRIQRYQPTFCVENPRPSPGDRRPGPRICQARGEELQKKYGLHEAHRALLPPGERNARSIKAARGGSGGRGSPNRLSKGSEGGIVQLLQQEVVLCLPAWHSQSMVWALEPGELPAILPDAARALQVCRGGSRSLLCLVFFSVARPFMLQAATRRSTTSSTWWRGWPRQRTGPTRSHL